MKTSDDIKGAQADAATELGLFAVAVTRDHGVIAMVSGCAVGMLAVRERLEPGQRREFDGMVLRALSINPADYVEQPKEGQG